MLFRSSIVPLILLANLCLGIYHNLSVWYKVTDRTRYGAYISVIGACITLGLNFILIPAHGAYGAAYASLLTQGLSAIAQVFIAYKRYNLKLDFCSVYNHLIINFRPSFNE